MTSGLSPCLLNAFVYFDDFRTVDVEADPEAYGVFAQIREGIYVVSQSCGDSVIYHATIFLSFFRLLSVL
jgi:hypothetical protein